MALQSATAAKIASLAVSLLTNGINETLIVVALDAKITAASTAIGKQRVYTIATDLDADFSDPLEPRLIQSDSSKILLSDVQDTLAASGYRVSHRCINTRAGKPDKIHMSIAWD